jgi:archaellum component FlaF (FlaF/FlaG flagellin family)
VQMDAVRLSAVMVALAIVYHEVYRHNEMLDRARAAVVSEYQLRMRMPFS